MESDPRAAWLRKYAREPAPWRGPVHAAPLLRGLRGAHASADASRSPQGARRIVELGAGGGKVGGALPPDALALDWAALPPGRPGLLADVRALPLREASVDALAAIHVLGHLDDPAAALAEWRRVLRGGGALALEVFARGDARDTASGTRTSDGIATRHFALDELRALLDAAGFAGEVAAEERRARWGLRRVLRGVLLAR